MIGSLKQVVQTESNVCIDNIGPLERKRRARFGALSLTIGLAVTFVLIVIGVGWYWRLGLFILFAPAMIGFFQSRERT